jgi:hypothetical protein
MLSPRTTLPGTRADGQLLRTFWMRYVSAYLRTGDDEPFGDASQIFTEPILTAMRNRLSMEVLTTSVFFTERLSNRILAARLHVRNSFFAIAINARFIIDPEVLAHALVEEFAHVQQTLDGIDFVTQREQFAYHERPYEQEAKQIATEILGYEPDAYDARLLRDEPVGSLFDRILAQSQEEV